MNEIARMFMALATSVLSTVGAAARESPVDWKAQWIWQVHDGPANAWVAFRKTVNIASAPA